MTMLMSMPSSAIGPPHDSFEFFYREHFDAVFTYLMRHTNRDRDTALDLTSQVFEEALRSHRAGNTQHLTIGWLITVARRRLIDGWRRERRRAPKLRLFVDVDLPPDPATVVEERRAVEYALEQLNPRYRYVLHARYVEDRAVVEIAQDLGETSDAITSALTRARRAFASSYPSAGLEEEAAQ